MEYGIAGRRSRFFGLDGGGWRELEEQAKPERVVELEVRSGWGCDDPGHDVSMCLSTCSGFMRDQQIGHATNPSSMHRHMSIARPAEKRMQGAYQVRVPALARANLTVQVLPSPGGLFLKSARRIWSCLA